MASLRGRAGLAAAVLFALCATPRAFVLAPALVPALRSGRLPAGSASELRCGAGGAPYVALTRELGKNGKLQKILKQRGVECRELPCITFENLGAPLAAALKDEWEYVVVTSPEAASVFSEGWAAAGKPDLSIACVGAGTKQALVELGLEPVFVPSKATGKVLAQELPGPAGCGRVLYPASAKAAKHVEDGLSARGFEVVRLNTYDTVSASWTDEQRQLGQDATVVALASPSATQIWAERLGTQHAAACIGETSAQACREAGFSQVFFPESPGLEGWANSVEQALAAVPKRL